MPPQHKSHSLSATPSSSSKGEGPAKIQPGQKYFSFFVLSNLVFFSLNPGHFVVLFLPTEPREPLWSRYLMKLGGLKLLSCDSGTKYELDGGRARSPGESRNLEIYIEECISNK